MYENRGWSVDIGTHGGNNWQDFGGVLDKGLEVIYWDIWGSKWQDIGGV